MHMRMHMHVQLHICKCTCFMRHTYVGSIHVDVDGATNAGPVIERRTDNQIVFATQLQ